MPEITYQEAVEEIKNRLDIVDVISKHVVLKKSGHNFMGLCPFHNEKSPSFTVTPSRQIFKCFGCGEGGDVLAFLMKIGNQNFADTIKEQAGLLGIDLPTGGNSAKAKEHKEEKERLLEAVNAAMKFYHNYLLENDKAIEYLEKRGVSEVARGKFFLGLAPNSNFELKNFLRSKGFTNDELYKAGLLYEKNGDYLDRFRNRIIIPIMDINGNAIAFGARAIMEGQNPKYLNSPDSSIYNKSSVMFGLYQAKDSIKDEDSVVIMEGYFDVISAQIAGVKNAVASCGTALTPQHIKLLSRYTLGRKIYLAFDADSAGKKATKTGANVIKEIFSGLGDIKQYDSSYMNNSDNVCEIRVVSQIGGKDPDEFIREFGVEEYKRQIQNAPLLLDFELEEALKNFKNTMSAQDKSILVQQIVYILQEIENPVILMDYIRNIAFKLNIDESVLRSQVKRIQGQELSLYRNVTIDTTPSLHKKLEGKSLVTRYDRMEANIIKLAFQADSKEKRVYFLQAIDGYKPKSEVNLKILNAIDKTMSEIDNVDELAKKLFAMFYNENEVQKELTDNMFSTGEFENLDYTSYTLILKETFERLNNIQSRQQKEKLRQGNKKADASEEDKINITRQICEHYSRSKQKMENS